MILTVKGREAVPETNKQTYPENKLARKLIGKTKGAASVLITIFTTN